MIKIVIFTNKNKEIFGFNADDHGEPIVCSAVTVLTVNAINSVEVFTDEHIVYEYDENGGFLHFEMPGIKQGEHNETAHLLMESMLLGLKAIEANYKKHIHILYKEV